MARGWSFELALSDNETVNSHPKIEFHNSVFRRVCTRYSWHVGILWYFTRTHPICFFLLLNTIRETHIWFCCYNVVFPPLIIIFVALYIPSTLDTTIDRSTYNTSIIPFVTAEIYSYKLVDNPQFILNTMRWISTHHSSHPSTGFRVLCRQVAQQVGHKSRAVRKLQRLLELQPSKDPEAPHRGPRGVRKKWWVNEKCWKVGVLHALSLITMSDSFGWIFGEVGLV